MGYRSDVSVVVYPDVGWYEGERGVMNKWQEEKYSALKLLMGTTFEPVIRQGFNEEWEDAMFALTFQMQDVKWYPNYDDVKAFEGMLEELVELGYSYELMRIGEDHDDVENRSGGKEIDYILGVRKEIVWNW